eukprot:XP_002257626.1 KIR protein [Plasmodium knowlesi strain H]
MSDDGGTSREVKCSRPVNALDAVYGAQLSQMVSGLQGKQNLAKHILRAGCCVLGTNTGNLEGSGACDLMYYTVGSIVHKKFGEDAFGETMERIHNYIVSVLGKGECKQLPRNSAKELFKLMERKVDYSLTLEGVLGKEVNPKTVNCEKYTKYLEQVAEACVKVKEQCRSSTKYHLGHLPSRQAYQDFDVMWRMYYDDQYVGTIKSALKSTMETHLKNDHCLNRILGAWYYTTNIMSTTNQAHQNRCSYFYYWLGMLIHNKLKTATGEAVGTTSSFSEAMNAIYEQLVKLPNTEDKSPCPKITTADNLDSTFFEYRKKVFDLYHDYGAIEKLLQDDGASGTAPCSKTFFNYIDNAKNSIEKAKSSCNSEQNPPSAYSGDDPCCKKLLQNGNTEPTEHHLSQLTCTEQTDLPDDGPEVELTTDCSTNPGVEIGQSSSSSDDGSIVGSVSGGIATIGIPAIGFFLYKYTNIFDGIKKSLFGGLNNGNNRRGRRSTFRHQHFDDTLTGNDYSTLGDDGSTTLGGGGGSSTLGGSSTDISTIYEEPPRRPSGRTRTGTNNRRPGNIRYYAT